jgi:hypothetical protein
LNAQENLDGWIEVMGDAAAVRGVLFFECPEAVMEARLLERGKTSGRADDNADSIKKRFAVFKTESIPIVDHYRSLGMVHHIIADKSVDDVWKIVNGIVAGVEASVASPSTTSSAKKSKTTGAVTYAAVGVTVVAHAVLYFLL